MGGRAVEGTSLENWRTAMYRGFESHPIRHPTYFSYFLTIDQHLLLDIIIKQNPC